jgi:hypothetical protein
LVAVGDSGNQANVCDFSVANLECTQPLLTTLNEQLKSGDVMVARSRRWTDFVAAPARESPAEQASK